MVVVAYFTAVLAQSGSTWKARDIEVDEYDALDDLAEVLRAVAIDDQPVLALVEHEDEWFALVRVDGEDDPRLFVSDLFAAARSSYGELLAPAADVQSDEDDEPVAAVAPPAPDVEVDVASDVEPDDLDVAGDDDGEDEDDIELVEAEVSAWAGETDLLEDLGVSGKSLRKLVEENADDPGFVLGEVGEQVGFADLLEASALTTSPPARAPQAADVVAMRRALDVASGALRTEDVPVGAVVLGPDGATLAEACNARESGADPTAHAEVLALRAAGRALGTWRLDGCTLVVTLEPCSMCAGALVLARVARLVFGAWDDKAGAAGSVRDVVRDGRLNHRVEVVAGVCEAESAALLRDFFAGRREA